MERCPKCYAIEVTSNNPRTEYNCGSTDYDQRPNTFIQSDRCITAEAIIESTRAFKGFLKW
jgi:hypothetical protein